jgi:hypothetical protein
VDFVLDDALDRPLAGGCARLPQHRYGRASQRPLWAPNFAHNELGGEAAVGGIPGHSLGLQTSSTSTTHAPTHLRAVKAGAGEPE